MLAIFYFPALCPRTNSINATIIENIITDKINCRIKVNKGIGLEVEKLNRCSEILNATNQKIPCASGDKFFRAS